MEHTAKFIANFSSTNSESKKHEKIRSIHFDRSGHVIGTNSHVLFASKSPYELSRSNKTYLSEEIKNGNFIETSNGFPEWRQVLPKKSAKKILINIPKWFCELKKVDEEVTMVLDYSNASKPFIKISKTTDETSVAFNSKYLAEFAGQEISILISSPEEATVILPKESKVDPHSKSLKDDIMSENWFYVLMPIRLDEKSINPKVYL